MTLAAHNGSPPMRVSLTRLLAERPSLGWLFFAAGVVTVYLVSLPAILFRPTGIEWAIWWPAVGIAVGLVIRAPRRAVPVALLILTAVFLVVQFSAGRPPELAIPFGVAAGLEVAVVALILRGGRERALHVSRVSDLARLLLAAVAGAAVLTVIASAAIATQVSLDAVVEYLQTSVLAHIIGVIVVTPLFFDHGRTSLRGREREFVLQVVSVIGTIAVIAAAASIGLPLAFLLLGPLVWGAARFSGRIVIVQFLVVMLVVSEFGEETGGLISVDGVQSQLSAFMVELFVLSSGVVILAVLALAGSQRRVLRLSSAAIAASLTGFADLRLRGGQWSVTAINDAARLSFGSEERPVEAIFERESVAALAAIAADLSEQAASLGGLARLTTLDERILETTVSPLLDPDRGAGDDDDRRYSLQFLDITDSLRLARAEEEELQRAAEMQRALLPDQPPAVEGWQVAGACLPSRDVGGDFFSWSTQSGALSITLGDVMGKGLGAGVMAASLQMAIRLQPPTASPGAVLTRSARAVADQLERASTFATVVHARIDTVTGVVEYADAGHGLTLIVRTGGGYERLASTSLPLGVDEDEVWLDSRATLGASDVLLSISDGALDAFPDSADPLADVAALVATAESAQDAVDAVLGLSRLPGIADDITVVAVRRSA
ncbi:MASE1 protein [Microcella alkaliphila]|uniref:MASE1 protein n=1 Tax=Microcella alkaliphila TaxID=279828 RepID=A0A4Q7TFM8_9MICO|nr:SpoIIE family protein phosphatase [Microcella alkaliphila]RZT58218.1 MASE1 protein [Microcella alkaliphila]